MAMSSRMQYNLWFLLLGLLAVPFVPFRLIGFPQIFSWLGLKASVFHFCCSRQRIVCSIPQSKEFVKHLHR